MRAGKPVTPAGMERGLAAATAVLVAAGLAGPGLAAPGPAAAASGRAADESVLSVRTGGDRTGTTGVAPLAGVRLALYPSATAAAPLADAWASCTSDGAGRCTFTVPETGGANTGKVFHVGQVAAPGGWFTNPSLRTGPGSGSGSVDTPYRFATPALAGGRTYSSTKDFMVDDTKGATTASTGIWQQSRVNPRLPARCGLDAALVLDLSASVGSALPALKKAADRFADALVGTPSRLALFTFDKTSPSTGTANHPELASVSTQAGADDFKKLYKGWNLGKGTNWDSGIWSVARAPQHYELVVVLTDGNPTYSAATGNGSTTRIREVENGIYSANAVKSEKTRLVALGVGKGVEGLTELNLRALSGTTAFDGSNVARADYFQTADYAAAGQALHDLVVHQCEGQLSIVKQIVPHGNEGDDVSGARPAGAGWKFTATTSTPGIGGLPDTQTTTADGTGSVAFEPGFIAASQAAVKVTETQRDGYELIAPGGRNAVCEDLAGGSKIPVTNAGAAGAAQPGFTVTVPSGKAVTCTLYNKRSVPKGSAHLTLVKKVVNGRGGKARPSDWRLRADGPDPISGASGSRPVTHAEVGPGTYRLSEAGGPRRYRPSAWRCEADGRPRQVKDGKVRLAAGDDVECTITNTYRPRPGPHCRSATTAASMACRPADPA
ncbi:hypothetical protein ACIBF1_29810 [Spirillospora sp. NPDC050679]